MRWRGDDPQAVAQAAQVLAEGGLVALPTETVYGLGARADRDAAVAQIFAAKGRPTDHPLIVHVLDAQDAQRFTPALPPAARRLIDAFWPGPLTVIVPRAPGMAEAAAAGQPTIGLRCPAHPVARALLEAARGLGVVGVAAPSANRFGRISPTRAEHVEAEFGDAVPVLDGGACPVGIESSIVDCSGARATLLRPGVLTRAQLEAALGEPLAEPGDTAPKAPGTLESHYAPRARLRLMPGPMLRQALDVLGPAPLKLAVYSRGSRPALLKPPSRWLAMPAQPQAAAQALFADLRELDAAGVDLIWVEEPPDEPAWEGVRDRLRRAAAG